MDFLDISFMYIRDVISVMGVAVICMGALRALYQLAMYVLYQKYNENYIRLKLGESIILGLEFTVGADIIGSLVEPDYYTVGLLGLIVVIRTVLSYFLSKELGELKPLSGQEKI